MNGFECDFKSVRVCIHRYVGVLSVVLLPNSNDVTSSTDDWSKWLVVERYEF